MRRIVAATFFRIIQIIISPIAVIAYAPFVVKLVTFSRRSGTSATVLASLYSRYMQHKLGTRHDEPCARLMMVMPNFHLLGCCTTDLYLGPFIGYGGLADPNYWALGHHFHADFSGDFVWGAQLGLDVPFKPTLDRGFHAGVRWLNLSQDTDAGSIDIDPLLVEAGLFFRF